MNLAEYRALSFDCYGTLIDCGELVHVAQSLYHDHVPARREGLRSVWINRRHDRPGWGATPEPEEAWSYDLEFPSMADFAAAADAAFVEREA
jgi:2-haloacid dehalogenase